MATLKVKIQEDIILDNQDYGSKRVLEIESITDVFKRIVSVPANVDTTVLMFTSTVGASDGALDIELVKYIRVTNLDSSNSVNLYIAIDVGEDDSSADNLAMILLESGKSFIMGTPSDGIAVEDDAGGGVSLSGNNIESIFIDSGSNAVQVEVFVASA
tara:strand:- start:2267 stop:2740 length:474 start_codon:yes stop_codon:yes gene_type:complete